MIFAIHYNVDIDYIYMLKICIDSSLYKVILILLFAVSFSRDRQIV